MRRTDFHYELPPELIAQAPAPERSASRLLALDGASGELRDLAFRDLPRLLRAMEPLLERPGAFVLGSNDYFAPVMKNPI